jgi:lipopolysaccharide export system protein LptA
MERTCIMPPRLPRLLPAALALLAALALSALAPVALAERADRNKPTLIEGDKCTSDELKQVTVCTGNVVLVRGTLRVAGERMEVRQDPEGYRKAVVIASPGQRASFRQRRDGARPGVEEWIEGYAERIEYDERTEDVRFIERALLKRLENEQQRDEVAGKFITYNTLTAQSNMDGGKEQGGDGRVRLILAPRDAPATPAAPGSKPTPVPLKPATQLDAKK